MSGGRTGWAGGRPRGLLGGTPESVPQSVPPQSGVQSPDVQSPDVQSSDVQSSDALSSDALSSDALSDASAPPTNVTPDQPAGTATATAGAIAAAEAIAADWAPAVGRILLGVVFVWFGFHELEHPGNWTGYVPVIPETSDVAVILVIMHGWVLFVLGIALIAGIEPRAASALATVIMLEIVISLAVTGLSDTALRDVGVLGLAICLTGCRHTRLLMRG